MVTPERVLDTLTEALGKRTQWDERPGLYALTDQDRALRLHEINLPNHLWSQLHPPLVPLVLATNGITARHTACGVALRFESFTISPDTGPEARDALRRRQQGLYAPSNQDIPGRLEERCIIAVLRSGDQFVVSQRRNPDGTAQPGTRQHNGPAEHGKLTGTVMEGLAAFLS